MLAGMHMEVYNWSACIHVVPKLCLDTLSFKLHMVKWLDVTQAVAVSVCIASNEQTKLTCSPCACLPLGAPSYTGTELPRHPKQRGDADVLPPAAAD